MIISLYHPVCNAQAQENHALWIDMPVRCMIVTRRLRLLASCKALRPFRAYLHVGPRMFRVATTPKKSKMHITAVFGTPRERLAIGQSPC